MSFWNRAEPGTNVLNSRSNAGVEQDEAALIAAAQADPTAFTPLYERYLSPIYRYCYVRLGSREAAEDATSEVFMKAFAALKNYRGGLFIAWLYRIAANVVIDTHRRRRPTFPVELADEVADADPTPEAHAIKQAESAELRRALAELPRKQQVVLELQLAGWSGEQIAEVIGKTPAAVKMLRFRAVSRLRQMLNPTGKPLDEVDNE